MRGKSLARLFLAVSLVGWAILDAGAVAFAEEVYTATLVAPRGLRTSRTARLTLTIRQFSTEEDAARYEKIYEEQGSEGLIQALRQQDRGVAEIQDGVRRRINHVRVFEGQAGTRVIIVTDQPLELPRGPKDDPAPPRKLDAVGIIQLELNKEGRGQGSMAEAVKIEITDEGVLQIQATSARPIELKDARQER